MLYPRAPPLDGEPTAADRQVLTDLVHAEQRRGNQANGVGFGDHDAAQAASDASRHADHPRPAAISVPVRWHPAASSTRCQARRAQA